MDRTLKVILQKGGRIQEIKGVKTGVLKTRVMITWKNSEHSFQEPMPNSPLLLSHLYFGARFLQE